MVVAVVVGLSIGFSSSTPDCAALDGCGSDDEMPVDWLLLLLLFSCCWM